MVSLRVLWKENFWEARKMKCPVCGTWTIVKEARESTVHGYRRRRECANEHKFTTQEIVIPDEVLKKERRDRLKANRESVVAVRQSRREAAAKTAQTKRKT